MGDIYKTVGCFGKLCWNELMGTFGLKIRVCAQSLPWIRQRQVYESGGHYSPPKINATNHFPFRTAHDVVWRNTSTFWLSWSQVTNVLFLKLCWANGSSVLLPKVAIWGLVIAIFIGVRIMLRIWMYKNPYNLVDDQPQVTSETSGIL